MYVCAVSAYFERPRPGQVAGGSLPVSGVPPYTCIKSRFSLILLRPSRQQTQSLPWCAGTTAKAARNEASAIGDSTAPYRYNGNAKHTRTHTHRNRRKATGMVIQINVHPQQTTFPCLLLPTDAIQRSFQTTGKPHRKPALRSENGLSRDTLVVNVVPANRNSASSRSRL